MNEGEEEEAGGEPDGQGLARFLLNGEEPEEMTAAFLKLSIPRR